MTRSYLYAICGMFSLAILSVFGATPASATGFGPTTYDVLSVGNPSREVASLKAVPEIFSGYMLVRISDRQGRPVRVGVNIPQHQGADDYGYGLALTNHDVLSGRHHTRE